MSSAASYGGDPAASGKDMTRFLIGDTGPSDFVHTDAEVNAVLADQNDDPLCAAICLVQVELAHLRKCINKSVGKFRADYKSRFDMSKELLEQLRIKKYGDKDGTSCPILEAPEGAPEPAPCSPCWPNGKRTDDCGPTFYKGWNGGNTCDTDIECD